MTGDAIEITLIVEFEGLRRPAVLFPIVNQENAGENLFVTLSELSV